MEQLKAKTEDFTGNLLIDSYKTISYPLIDKRRPTRFPDALLRQQIEQVSDWKILTIVLNETGVTAENVFSKSRKMDVLMARHMIIYFLTFDLGRPFSNIGNLFYKHHASAIHSRDVIENMIDTDKHFRLRIIEIATRLTF